MSAERLWGPPESSPPSTRAAVVRSPPPSTSATAANLLRNVSLTSTEAQETMFCSVQALLQILIAVHEFKFDSARDIDLRFGLLRSTAPVTMGGPKCQDLEALRSRSASRLHMHALNHTRKRHTAARLNSRNSRIHCARVCAASEAAWAGANCRVRPIFQRTRHKCNVCGRPELELECLNDVLGHMCAPRRRNNKFTCRSATHW